MIDQMSFVDPNAFGFQDQLRLKRLQSGLSEVDDQLDSGEIDPEMASQYKQGLMQRIQPLAQRQQQSMQQGMQQQFQMLQHQSAMQEAIDQQNAIARAQNFNKMMATDVDPVTGATVKFFPKKPGEWEEVEHKSYNAQQDRQVGQWSDALASAAPDAGAGMTGQDSQDNPDFPQSTRDEVKAAMAQVDAPSPSAQTPSGKFTFGGKEYQYSKTLGAPKEDWQHWPGMPPTEAQIRALNAYNSGQHLDADVYQQAVNDRLAQQAGHEGGAPKRIPYALLAEFNQRAMYATQGMVGAHRQAAIASLIEHQAADYNRQQQHQQDMEARRQLKQTPAAAKAEQLARVEEAKRTRLGDLIKHHFDAISKERQAEVAKGSEPTGFLKDANSMMDEATARAQYMDKKIHPEAYPQDTVGPQSQGTATAATAAPLPRQVGADIGKILSRFTPGPNTVVAPREAEVPAKHLDYLDTTAGDWIDYYRSNHPIRSISPFSPVSTRLVTLGDMRSVLGKAKARGKMTSEERVRYNDLLGRLGDEDMQREMALEQ